MNKLEFILQNASRKMDSAPFKGDGGQNSSGERSDVKPIGSDFDVFLKSISATRGTSNEQYGQIATPARLVDMESDPVCSESSKAQDDSDLDQNGLLKEFISADTIVPRQEASPSFAVSIIPPTQLSSAPAKQPTASSAGSSSGSLLELIRRKEDTGASDVMQRVASASYMKASVLHQEAHFKPVLPNSLPNDANAVSNETLEGLRNGSGQPTSSLRNAAEQFLSGHSPLEATASKAVDASSGSSSPLATDQSSDTPLFQRIADAIISDVARNTNEQVENTARSQVQPSIVLRPSEGVLRVLNIQLHPVELGVVTVKMRLSGEKLEMELHTSNSETADILRKDTEKLSSLLRTSGYRPDIVTVHLVTADGAQQDSSAGQRPQWLAQSNSNGFHQGNNGQGDRTKYPAETHDNLGQKVQNGAEEKPVGVAGTGGVYL